MQKNIQIRQAQSSDLEAVYGTLHEVATWLTERGETLWRDDEIDRARIADDVNKGLFFIAERDGTVAGVVKFQLEDPLFWPDLPTGEAAFIHRLAVRRAFAGGEISTALLNWAAARTRILGRRFLRLDTDAARPKLRAVYEKYGFRHHSDRHVGPYFVARYELEVCELEITK